MDSRNDGKQLQIASLRVIAMLLAVAAAVWLTIELRTLLVSLIIALTLASAIAPIAEWGETKRIPRVVMILGVYVAVAALYGVIAVALMPAIREQATNLYRNLPDYMLRLTGVYDTVKGVAGGPAADALKVDTQMVQNIAMKIGNETLDVTAGLFGLILNGLLVLFLTAYFVIEAKEIWKKLLIWVPPRYRLRCASLILPLGARMGGYVRGQLLVSLAVACFITVGLTILNVNYGLVLGILAGLLNLVPFVGSFIALVFATIVAFNQSLFLAGAVLCLFAFEQWVESNFIVPHLLGRHVELHPLIVLFAILIGATLMGVPGALVAVPMASAGLFLAQEFYLKSINPPETLDIEAPAAEPERAPVST